MLKGSFVELGRGGDHQGHESRVGTAWPHLATKMICAKGFILKHRRTQDRRRVWKMMGARAAHLKETKEHSGKFYNSPANIGGKEVEVFEAQPPPRRPGEIIHVTCRC